MSLDVTSLVLDYVQKTGMKTNVPLMSALKVIKEKIAMAEQINSDLEINFKNWGVGAFAKCPNCQSDTLLEFAACHWCDQMLLDSTRPTNEVEVKTPTARAVKAKIGNEPEATLNFEGKAPNTDIAKTEEKSQAETPVADKIKLLTELSVTAAVNETSGAELQKINVMAGLNIDPKKDCDGKKSLFRKAIVDGLHKAIEALKVEEPVIGKTRAKRGSKAKAKKEDDGDDVLDSVDPTPFVDEKETKAKGGKKAKVVEIDESELTDEKPKKGTKNKVETAKTEDDDIFEDDGDEDVDADEETEIAVAIDDDFGDVDLTGIDADALKSDDDDEFDLNDDD